MLAPMDVMFLAVLLVAAAFAIPAVRSALGDLRGNLRQQQVGRTGASAVAEIVEVTVVAEGRDRGSRQLGPIEVITRSDRRGRAEAAELPRYRILLRFNAPGHGLVVADLERELTTDQLDLLTPGHRVEIHHDPTHPEHVALDLARLRQRGPQS